MLSRSVNTYTGLWFGTNEESVVELMLACLSPCAFTREEIEEAAWEAYSKGRG
jgi:hypothetical protein